MYLNKIYNEDCLGNKELVTGMWRIPDKSIDCIICDLPYGTTWAKWDKVINMNELWSHYNRVIKDNGAIVLFSTQPFTTQLIASNMKNYKYTWYWDKNNCGNFLNAKRQPLRKIEEINVFNKHNYYPQGLKDYNKLRDRGHSSETTMQNYNNVWMQEKTGYPNNLLHFPLEKDKIHPTAKPVALIEYLIKTYTNEGETVLDNCMGSGTTAIACLNTNRNYIGFELDEEYYNKSINRIELHNKELIIT